MTRLTVGTLDLRQALTAVAVHATDDPDIPTFNRVRLEVGPVNLTVTATNGYTAGHALVSVIDNVDGEAGAPFDLSPQDVKEVLALFRSSKETEQSDTLQLQVDDKHTTVTDVSGLFSGKSLVLPRLPLEGNFPDIEGLIGQHIADGFFGPFDGDRLIADGRKLASFTKAAAAYGQPLVLEPCGTTAPRLIVLCGDSFIGLLTTMRPDDEDRAAQMREWRDAWRRRLPDKQRRVGNPNPSEPATTEGDT